MGQKGQDKSMNLSALLITTHPSGTDLAILIMRVALGICFSIHGLGKLGIVGSGNMKGFESWLQSLGLPFAAVQARMAMLAELIGGVALALGLFMRPVCFILLFTMLVATFVGHKGAGYLITNNPPGNEYSLNLAILMVVLALLGPGTYALDYLLFASV